MVAFIKYGWNKVIKVIEKMSTLNEQIQRLQTAKSAIDNSLINRGIIIPNGATLDSYHTLIQQIKTGTSSQDVTALKDNILEGTTTVTADSNDEIVEGTMVNNGSFSHTINAGSNIIVPRGYHPGNGIISVRSLADETPGTATAARIISGDTAWVNGSKLTGSMSIMSATGFSASAASSTSIKISWTNPSKGPWSGIKIRYSTSGYPGTTGGTLVYTGAGNSTSAGGSNYVNITGLSIGTTYYFTCYSYANGLGDSAASYNCTAKTSGLMIYDYGKAIATPQDCTHYSNLTINSNNIHIKGHTHDLSGYDSLNYYGGVRICFSVRNLGILPNIDNYSNVVIALNPKAMATSGANNPFNFTFAFRNSYKSGTFLKLSTRTSLTLNTINTIKIPITSGNKTTYKNLYSSNGHPYTFNYGGNYTTDSGEDWLEYYFKEHIIYQIYLE